MTLSIGRFEELIVLRLSRTEDDDYLQNQLLRLSKSEARVVLLYATQCDDYYAIFVILFIDTVHLSGDSVAEWLACWTQAQKSPGSNRSHDAIG